MCGIAGFISEHKEISGDCLRKMLDMLVHRGPDDSGMQIFNRDEAEQQPIVGLAHQRLSIIDLSPAGHQPMSNEDGMVWISYNGECYNFQSLFRELKAKGHAFVSRSDTEVLIHGYEEWGVEGLLSRLNGMFAFAIWDQHKRELILVRDRLGKKPLYYCATNSGALIFASEIKALVAGGFVDEGDIDESSLIQFWIYGYSTGSQTIYRNVHRVPPGHYLIWKNGKIVLQEYWDAVFGRNEYGQRSENDLTDELESLLLDAIRLRLISDVPVGVFLSGGIDSSVIAALGARITNQNIRSFSIGFSEKKFDETSYACAVAEHLGIENIVLTMTDNLEPFFQQISRHFDELFGDSSAIPTYFVAKLAREYVTVALTGDAGDELFSGYDSYKKALSVWGSRDQRKMFRGRVGAFQQLIDFFQLRFIPEERRLSAFDRIMPLAKLKNVLTPAVLQKVSSVNAFQEREQWYLRVANADLLSQMQYVNMKTYLPDDILVKVDRMSMAHGLECRSPLLDFRIVEFASRLAFHQKISPDGTGKVLLRNILKRHLPENLIDRPKMGFSIPWSEWCQGPLGREIEAKWLKMNSPYFRQDAVSFLFPKNKLGWPARQWNAFCTVNFFNN
jgi:asparagine synthase (glutamine-hydrolysing)